MLARQVFCVQAFVHATCCYITIVYYQATHQEMVSSSPTDGASLTCRLWGLAHYLHMLSESCHRICCKHAGLCNVYCLVYFVILSTHQHTSVTDMINQLSSGESMSLAWGLTSKDASHHCTHQACFLLLLFSVSDMLCVYVHNTVYTCRCRDM